MFNIVNAINYRIIRLLIIEQMLIVHLSTKLDQRDSGGVKVNGREHVFFIIR